MRVVEVTAFGDPEVLAARDAQDPVAGPGQVVVEVAVADVLFLDTQLRAGWGEGFFQLDPPYVPGAGVAGKVVAASDDVDGGWLNRRVVASLGQTGGYAGRTAVPVESLIEIPEELGTKEALALLHDGSTAYGVVERAGITPGDWVLVTAAGGSLGLVLVQLAKAAGARVIGAARGERKLHVVRDMGADVAVDYTVAGWSDRVREATAGQGVNVVFDGAGGALGADAFQVTAAGARFHSYGAASGTFAEIDPAEAERRGVAVFGILDDPPGADTKKKLAERALTEAVAGRIKPHIGQTFPLERAVDAHAAIAAREAVGKTLLVV